MKVKKTKKIKKSFNCFLCGDNNIGKKTLLYTYKNGKIPDEEAKMYLFNEYSYCTIDVFVDNFEIKMKTFMLSGADNYCTHRRSEHLANYATIFCFSLVNEFSFKKIRNEYFREFVEWSVKKPFILVGFKKDKRDLNLKNNIRENNNEHYFCEDNDIITTEMGEKLKKEIGASAYIECSSFNIINVHEVFEEASRAILQASIDTDASNDQINDHSCCSIF